MVARRGALSGFAATRYAIDPRPWPLLADVRTTHSALLDAVHKQSRARSIERLPDPPAAAAASIEFVRVTPQREAEGPVTERSADVQDADAARSTSANSRVARTAPVLQFPYLRCSSVEKGVCLLALARNSAHWTNKVKFFSSTRVPLTAAHHCDRSRL